MGRKPFFATRKWTECEQTSEHEFLPTISQPVCIKAVQGQNCSFSILILRALDAVYKKKNEQHLIKYFSHSHQFIKKYC